MPTVQQLYELWASNEYAELKESLEQSLAPRGTDSLLQTFAALEPQPGQLVVDIGARDALGAITLVREHGLRAIAIDPVPLHSERAREAVGEAGLEDRIDIVEGAIESLPLDDSSVDWIWCRDVLVHVDVDRGLAECARVLKPGGAMVAYVTLATDRLEPREREELMAAAAIRIFDPRPIEAAARDAGLATRSVDRLGSEWRERWLEDGDWSADHDLIRLARLRRGDFDGRVADAVWGGFVWGVYQLLGKTCPTVYVWERRA
jgi:ubiquinone/menaquinone biosynthesis C-methylase UbiE